MIGPFTGDYAFLSNFYAAGFSLSGVRFPTVEHYYQARKAASPEEAGWVLAAPTPGEAKKRGRSVRLSPAFEQDKRAVMMTGVLAKFTQNPELRYRLAVTAPEPLEEVNYWGDRYWGTVDGAGENWLGRILVMVREVLA